MDNDWEVLEGKPSDWVECFYKNGKIPCAREKYIAMLETAEIAGDPSLQRTYKVRMVSYNTLLYE